MQIFLVVAALVPRPGLQISECMSRFGPHKGPKPPKTCECEGSGDQIGAKNRSFVTSVWSQTADHLTK